MENIEPAIEFHLLCTVTTHPQSIFGIKNLNGSWQGLFGMLENEEVDVILPLSITNERSQDFDATFPIKEQG